jgi:2-C-methyl-D-erythritol 4-phosphate cytidylyltransferase
MTLSEAARERLADVVEMQPTKNAELQDRWDLDSGSDVHAYLEAELGEYYFRDEDSLIRATPEAASIIDGDADPMTLTVSPLQAAVVSVLAGTTEEPDSVVATLQAVRKTGRDPSVDEVRAALRSLVDKGVVERVQRTVPTYRLAAQRESLNLETVQG